MDIISEFENGDVIACIDANDIPLHNAAPDLLAALDSMLALFADHAQYDEEGFETAAILAAQIAIAKAKGN